MTNAPMVLMIGASTDHQALRSLFRGELASCVIVLVQNLPNRTAGLDLDDLRQMTAWPVISVEKLTPLESGKIFVIPAEHLAQFRNQREIDVHPFTSPDDALGVIDRLFSSGAEHFTTKSIGVVLSGAGSDGGQGLKLISDAGGLTLVQDPDDASLQSMPAYALGLEVADHVIPAHEMMAEINAFQHYSADAASQSRVQIELHLDAICLVLKRQTSHDFRHYKSSTLIRRIQRRMHVIHIDAVEAYLDLLKSVPGEVEFLFKELLVNVTSFFRDPLSLEALREKVVDQLVEAAPVSERIRVWVAGCSTGEEAYSLAILFLECLEKRGRKSEVQIIATDIDEHALGIARKGAYPASIAAVVSERRLERFFSRKAGKYIIKKEVRELCLFSAHNLVNDPPFSQIDLISCRNVLIYFGSHLQQKLIPVFHYALRGSGFLFLGNSESVSGHGELFKTVSIKDRIVQKKATAIMAGTDITRSFSAMQAAKQLGSAPLKQADIHLVGQRILLDEFAPRYAVVSEDQSVISLSEGMAAYLNYPIGVYEGTLGRLIRPELRVALRSAFLEAQKEKRKIVHPGASFRLGEDVHRVRVTVQPMPQLGFDDGIYMVVFTDLGVVSDSESHASREQDRKVEFSVVEQLEKELAHVKSDLDRTVQDLEASNEELKSSNEELLSMNEELQSANEELESSKEEVQAANDTLSRANTDLENLLSSTQIATLFLGDDLVIKSFTPAVTQIYNILARDIGRSILDITHGAQFLPAFPAEAARLGGQDAEITMPDGRVFLRRILPYKVDGDRLDGLVITFTNVTELRQQEGVFQAVANASPALLWITDRAGSADYFNARWFNLTGSRTPECQGLGWLKVVDPPYRPEVERRLQEGLASLNAFNFETPFRRADGTSRWVTVMALPVTTSGKIITRWIFNAFDIDEAKKLQRRTSDSELFFRRLSSLIPQKLWMADAAGNVKYFSQQWLEFVGHDLTHQLQHWLESVHPNDRERLRTAWQQSLQTNEDYELEYNLRRADGEYRWVISRATRFIDASGQATWMGSTTDIERRRRDELQLIDRNKLLNEQVAVSQTSSQLKSAFVANISHEIRTPIGAIIGFGDLLADMPDLPSDACDYVERIRRNASHLAMLINDVLDLSKIEANRLEIEKDYFDPRSVLADTFSMLGLNAREKGLMLKEHWVGPVPSEIYSDRLRFRQILLNIIGNAIKFTNRGGVEVELQMIDSGGSEGRGLQIDVADTGIGLSQADLGGIFKPFGQADASITRRFGGTGLGLALSAKLAAALGGSLSVVASTPGVGTTFRITLTIGAPRDAFRALRAGTQVANLPDLTGIKVLIADDASDNLILVSRFLSASGAVVATASNGRQAVEAALVDVYDVVLMDIQMPELDGYEAMAMLNEHGFKPPVVALTAHAMKEERSRALAAGFKGYLTKPVKRTDLVLMIVKLLAPADGEKPILSPLV